MKFEIKDCYKDALLFSLETNSLKLCVEAAVKSGANLFSADLTGADLTEATGINPNLYTPLLMLLDQPGKIRAYKLVNKYHGGFGINVATLNWCMKEWCKGRKILLVEFTAKDIAAIPSGTDRKFRVRKCKVIRALDLKKIGLTVPKEKK